MVEKRKPSQGLLCTCLSLSAFPLPWVQCHLNKQSRRNIVHSLDNLEGDIWYLMSQWVDSESCTGRW